MNFDQQINSLTDPVKATFSGPSDIITKILNYSFTIAGIALLLYFIYGGYQIFLSGGDPKKVSEGKATITNAIVGFVIVFVAFWIVQLFGNLLGLKTLVGGSNTPF